MLAFQACLIPIGSFLFIFSIGLFIISPRKPPFALPDALYSLLVTFTYIYHNTYHLVSLLLPYMFAYTPCKFSYPQSVNFSQASLPTQFLVQSRSSVNICQMNNLTPTKPYFRYYFAGSNSGSTLRKSPDKLTIWKLHVCTIVPLFRQALLSY